MNRLPLAVLGMGAALAAGALPAAAATCYEVIDRSDAVVFRGLATPVDLSDAGAAAREAMRSRGESLVIFDTDNCRVVARTVASGGKPLSVEEIVAGYQGFGGPGAARQGDRGGGVYAPAQSDAGSIAPAAQGAKASRAAGYR